jgi:hypothetical protein
MGVMKCDRIECDNVMCDRYSDMWGYLCEECFRELVVRGVHTDIGSFMDTPPSRSLSQATEAFFNEIFK